MQCFETRSIINEDTMEVLKKHSKKTTSKIVFSFSALIFSAFIIWGVIAQSNIPRDIGFAGAIVYMSLLYIRDLFSPDQVWERIEESYGKRELEMIVTFLEDKIKVLDPDSCGIMYYNYGIIVGFIEIRDIYFLATKAGQSIAVNKTSLVQEEINEDFIHFIKEKCRNIKWTK